MKRRQLVLGGAAAAAAASGAGVAWWRGRPPETDPSEALWRLRLSEPGGGELLLRTFRGRPLLVNFWATWCAPCVAELPLLDAFARGHPGWQVVGLAVDQLEPVQRFLSRHPVSYRVGLAGSDGIDVARRLGNVAGGLPFSLVVTAGGRVTRQKLGALDPADLQAWSRAGA